MKFSSFIATILVVIVSVFLASNDKFVHANLSSPPSINQPLTIPKNYSKLLLEKSLECFHNDLKRVHDLPISSLTTPCWEVSRDSTFTKSWTYADWERHQAQSALRYVRHVGTWVVSTTAQNIIPTIMVVAAWTVLLFKATYRFSFNMSAAKFAMTLGFIQAPILLLLTLKTNRSLDRMLETRKAWGTLSRASRSLTGLVGTYVMENDPESALLIARYLALVGWSLKASFRKNDDDTDMICAMFQDFPKERDWLLNCPTKRPIGIVTRIRYLLSVLGKDRSHGGISIPPIIMLRMEEALHDIETTIGVCSRVFLSPVPPTYTRHTSRVLVLYMFLLPAALVGTGVSLLPAIVTSTFASYVLVGIDEIGLEIEYPFHLLPMFSMSKSIQQEVENQINILSCIPNMPSNLTNLDAKKY